MLEASEKFLVSDESRLAAELSASVQRLIVDEAAATVAGPICVKRQISRTTAPHGLTTAEVKRAFNATNCMAKQRRQIWFATLGDGLQDMDAGEARDRAAAFLKALVSEQKKHGLPQYWLQVWECSGGLHTHVIFIGNRRIIERLRNSALSGQFLHVRWAYDAYGLPIYLSKERTPQTQFGIGAFIRGARKRGSHQLPGGGDRVRLSAALKREAIAAGYVEPWQQTNARRKETREPHKLYTLRRRKAPVHAGQVVLFPELERQPARLRDYHGGLMTPAQAIEAEFLRQRLGLSQHQLVQLIGLSQPHYANVVRGHDNMSRYAARRLREALISQPQKAA